MAQSQEVQKKLNPHYNKLFQCKKFFGYFFRNIEIFFFLNLLHLNSFQVEKITKYPDLSIPALWPVYCGDGITCSVF